MTITLTRQKNLYLKNLEALSPPYCKNGLGYVSVFCGGGGLDLGFAAAGFTPLFSSDIIPSFCETVKNNLKKHLVEPHDITELSGNYVLDVVGKKVSVVIGGPPCQSFSILGTRKSTNDPRGKLIYEYARFIKEINPDSFLFENVPGILTINKGVDWQELLSFFKKETGYHIKWTKMNSVWFGVPQYRQRVIAVGFRDKKACSKFQWPEPTHAESIDQLEFNREHPIIAELALENIGDLPNHIFREHSERVMMRYSQVPPGGRDRKDHTDRIDPNKPSGTVLVGSGAGGGRPFIHPYEHRHITVREAARLQSFPDWWKFEGGPTSAYRQVGNAVPPLMARKIAIEIFNALEVLK
jgi:DNA (cytosine-5)-methyltransferase 1